MLLNFRAIDRAFDVERYVLDTHPDAQRSNGNLVVQCPRCEKHKFWVLTVDRGDDARAGAWRCFAPDCSDAGNGALSLVRRLEDCDTFAALELVNKFQKGNQPLIDLRRLVEERLAGEVEVWDDRDHRVPLPDEFVACASRASGSFPAYFRERGIGPKKAARYGLGWCEDGYFANRLVVPVKSGGDVAFFVARWMATSPPKCAGKYLPCKRCGGVEAHKKLKKTLYPKGARPGRYLFNYDRARHCQTIRIVEGVFDAVHVGKSAVATFGTSLSQYQLELLMRTAAAEITIMWDRDAIDKARALALRLSDLWRVRVVELPDDRDPDEHTLESLRGLELASPLMGVSAARRSYVMSRLEHKKTYAVVDR